MDARSAASAPRISVVVPVYNVEDYLAWCLDSLLAQDLPSFEAILVNDGSPDGSRAIAQRYADADARFKIVDKENGGLSSARNAGIAAAKAPIVAFLDSDDRFTPDACRVIVEAFERTHADVVTFGANAYPAESAYPWRFSARAWHCVRRECSLWRGSGIRLCYLSARGYNGVYIQ